MASGLAGNLSIINATPFAWQRIGQNAQQMQHWNFPEKIHPGHLVSVPAVWGVAGDISGDNAQARYSIALEDGTTVGFQLQAQYGDGPKFVVVYDNTSTFGNPPGTSINLGFANDAGTPFIFSGELQESFESTNPPENWMHQNLPSIGCQPLTRLCMPASHDAGMSIINGKTSRAVTDENTLTHFDDVAAQLSAGFRYFDIRPVIASGQFFTGHYSKVFGIWEGGNGQSMAAIISQINAFLDTHHELVILDLSHTLNTDSGYDTLSQDELNHLFKQLLDLKYRYVADPGIKNLATLKLNDLIADGPAVLIILDNAQANEHMEPGDFATKGFYTNAKFPTFNQFADTDNVGKMSSDQMSKMKSFGSNGMFLLSWTLSTDLNVRKLALEAHAALFQDLWPAMSKKTFPNFIMVDGIGAQSQINPGNVAALCMAINHAFNGDCQS